MYVLDIELRTAGLILFNSCHYVHVSYIHTSFPWGVANDFGSRRRLVSTKTWLKRPLLVLCRCMLQTVRKSQRSHPIFIIMARVRVGMCTSIMYVCTTPNPSVSVMAEEHPMKPQIISRVAQSRRERRKKKATHFAQYLICTMYSVLRVVTILTNGVRSTECIDRRIHISATTTQSPHLKWD